MGQHVLPGRRSQLATSLSRRGEVDPHERRELARVRERGHRAAKRFLDLGPPIRNLKAAAGSQLVGTRVHRLGVLDPRRTTAITHARAVQVEADLRRAIERDSFVIGDWAASEKLPQF
jgi:hypothetical protein